MSKLTKRFSNETLNHFYYNDEILNLMRKVNKTSQDYANWENDSDGSDSATGLELEEAMESAIREFTGTALEAMTVLTWRDAEKVPFCPMCGSSDTNSMGPVKGDGNTSSRLRNDYFFCDDCGGEITLR